jgi:hypothetical protein
VSNASSTNALSRSAAAVPIAGLLGHIIEQTSSNNTAGERLVKRVGQRVRTKGRASDCRGSPGVPSASVGHSGPVVGHSCLCFGRPGHNGWVASVLLVEKVSHLRSTQRGHREPRACCERMNGERAPIAPLDAASAQNAPRFGRSRRQDAHAGHLPGTVACGGHRSHSSDNSV